MTDETRVLYNDTCPLCRFEIDHYRARAEATGAGIGFEPLDRAESWGLSADQAARRLHVRQGDRLLSGFDAFRAIWSALPRWRWLARITGLPVLRHVLSFVYDRAVGPMLYRAHLRRQSRKRAG